jgi:chromatin remodeling complex protein RSC6
MPNHIWALPSAPESAEMLLNYGRLLMNEPNTGPKTNPFNKELTPSLALAVIVGSEPLPRTEVNKRLWDYIKAHNLQSAADKQYPLRRAAESGDGQR